HGKREEQRVRDLHQLVRVLLIRDGTADATDEQGKQRSVSPGLAVEPKPMALRDRGTGLHIEKLVEEEPRHVRGIGQGAPRHEHGDDRRPDDMARNDEPAVAHPPGHVRAQWYAGAQRYPENPCTWRRSSQSSCPSTTRRRRWRARSRTRWRRNCLSRAGR